MSNQIDWMVNHARRGRIDRRKFMDRVTALGGTATSASALLTKAGVAETPPWGSSYAHGPKWWRMAP